MEKENEDVQKEVVEQEEVATTEKVVEEEDSETITISKFDYKKLDRKARAYDSGKGNQTSKQEEKVDSQGNFIDTVFMVKDLSQDEYDTLRDESKDLGIPFEKFVGSNSGKTLLDKVRAEKKSKDSSEELTSKSPVFQKYTQADLKGMSAKELEKILPH